MFADAINSSRINRSKTKFSKMNVSRINSSRINTIQSLIKDKNRFKVEIQITVYVK